LQESFAEAMKLSPGALATGNWQLATAFHAMLRKTRYLFEGSLC
jgi:hypothetical protein